MSVDIRSSTAAVPEVSNDNSQVKSKVGHVAKFAEINDDQLSNDEELYPKSLSDIYKISFGNSKEIHEYLSLNKEELKSFINNSYWKKIRYFIGLFYILLILFLLIGSILLIVFSTKCPTKTKLNWYEKDFIYEIDLQMFYDSNNDGQGDLQGLIKKFDYLQKYSFKTILFQSTIFSNQQNFDLIQLNQNILNQTYFDSFIKFIHRKDMHLILDLPLSSTNQRNSSFWYGNNQTQIQNQCNEDQSSLGCQYYQSYGRLPLDFNQLEINEQAQNRIFYWLLEKNIDGIRIDLPLELNEEKNSYEISYKTISKWNLIKNQIEQKTHTKLILYDIPSNLIHLLNKTDLQNQIIYPIFDDNSSLITSKQINEQINSLPKFSKFQSNKQIISKEIQLTMLMLFRGTPIILYGEEFGLEYNKNRLMLWTSDKPCGGFSNCTTTNCLRLFSLFNINSFETNVKREEAIDGNPNESLLRLFEYLTKLRREDSFRYGLFEKGYSEELNLFWFIRELSGSRGYLILINLNKKEKEFSHLSLYKLTNHLIPQYITYEYQWPKKFNTFYSNSTYINADNLFLSSQSISIFSWKTKLIKPNILLEKARKFLVD